MKNYHRGNDNTHNDQLITFFGTYSNFYNCYMPNIGEFEDSVETEHLKHGDKIILCAPLYNLSAIFKFAEIFSCSTPEEQKAFIKVGYPLLKIKLWK